MRSNQETKHSRQSGQTLVAAMIILGVLLIVGFVFLGIVNRNILQSGRARQRSIANDLAEAGIRYMHAQMLYSASGADWRGFPTPPIGARDPDYDFLLPDPDANPLNGDQGGPDGLGAYSRVNQGAGRFLVRARYAPSDAFLFSTAPNGPLRQPGRAKSYLILEALGRVGQVNAQDPTTLVNNYRRESRKLIAFASIGMIESAMYITNKDRVSRPADIGIPNPLGAMYEGNPVNVPMELGSALPMFNFGNPPTPSPGPVPFGGSLYSNAPVVVHGRMIANLNAPLGESWLVNGPIVGADPTSSLTLNRSAFAGVWTTTTYVLQNGTAPSLDSRSVNFSTLFGAIRDEEQGIDLDGYWRAVGRKEAPSMLVAHPESGVNRYYTLTRDSGVFLNSGNSGRFGHGKGVYVNNFADRQIRSDESGRMDVGSAESLLFDWFNPNNGQANSGWIGPYYVPRGAYLLMDPGGWSILRDSRSTGQERTWKNPNGTDTGSMGIRYRVGRATNGSIHVLNNYTSPAVNINGNLTPADFDLGQPFNGVLYFEGNVRMRGTIPTDVQLTVVSGATIYVEGSILKGILRTNVTDPGGPPSPSQRITRPTRSMAMLMAKDYVAVNPSMFFGPSPIQDVFEVNESASPVSWNPIEIATGGGTFTFRTEMLFDPTSGAGITNPSSWQPYSLQYAEFGTPANTLNSRLLLSHTAADSGAGSLSFVSLDVNFGLPSSNYFFQMAPPNSAAPFFATPYGAIYGLGGETWQIYPKFESTAFSLIDPTNAVPDPNGLSVRANNPATFGDFRVLIGEANDLMIRTAQVGPTQPQPYRLARTAVVPDDVRIEAAVYAEQGSFVIIPGHWMNPNPNDTRDAFNARVIALQAPPFSLTQADAVRQAWQERIESFGAGPDTPFYGEPMDVRVQIFGSVSQNMPLPMSYQADWLRKWGWIPRQLGAQFRISGSNANPSLIPQAHVPAGYDITNAGPDRYVPNLIVSYDPALATASENGFGSDYLRRDRFGRPLAPMPSLPVSPSLVYFGEVLQ